jgi:hypothetical protein
VDRDEHRTSQGEQLTKTQVAVVIKTFRGEQLTKTQVAVVIKEVLESKRAFFCRQRTLA